MDEGDAERISAEELERARLGRATPENAIWLSESDYMELEIFMKDLIGWAGQPAMVPRIEEQAYRYFHRLAYHREAPT